MKAVMPTLLPDVAELRKRTGADRWDEMWEGVLHLAAAPTFDHQDLEGDLATWLRLHWARPRKAKVLQQVNVAPPGGWPDNYRIPDIILLTRTRRLRINRGEYLEGAPNGAIEIHSPGDEAYDKLDFYAELEVPEVWIIDRDTRAPEIYLLVNGRYRKVRPGAGGWLHSRRFGIELRRTRPGKLAVRLAGDESTREDLPVD